MNKLGDKAQQYLREEKMQYKIINLEVDEIDRIKKLWKELIDYHEDKSKHFSKRFSNYKFSEHKKELLKKTDKGKIKIDLVKGQNNHDIGYCVSLINEKKEGEIESLYLKSKYRNEGIGAKLMERALQWFEEKEINDIKIEIAVGNEEVATFYDKFDFSPFSIMLRNNST